MSTYRLKGTSGSVINEVFLLSERLLIGRADDCDIRIDQEAVAAHHAEVMLNDEGKVRVRDLGSGSGTRVNGEKIIASALMGGDELHIGNCRLMLQVPGLRSESVLSAKATRPPPARWPWLLLLAIASAAILAWEYGWFAWFEPGSR